MTAAEKRVDGENVQIQAMLDKKAARKRIIEKIIPYAGLAFVLIFFTIVTDGLFLSSANLSNLISQCFTLTIIAVGASFVYAQGAMDFSIGPSCGVAQLVGGLLLVRLGMPLPIVIAAVLIVPILSTMVVATIAIVFNVPVFIGSMCVRSVLAGILTVGVANADINIGMTKYGYMNSTVLKAVIIITVFAVGAYLFNFTSLGKQSKAMGGNRNTARQAGVKVISRSYIAYLLLGICVGIASVFSMFRSGKITAVSGSGLEFSIMLAIVLGGFPMSGGEKSSVLAAVIGAVTSVFLTNGLSVWGIDPGYINSIKGILFIIIVGVSYDRSRGKLIN